MSSSLIVYFEEYGAVQYPPDPVTPDSDADYGQVLALLGARLDALARSLGARPLSEFHYSDPEMLAAIASELDGRPRENVERILATQRQWHDVVDARTTVEILLAYLSDLAPAKTAELHRDLLLGGRLDPLLNDLRALARTLSSNDARFHIETM